MLILTSDVKEKLRVKISACKLETLIYGKQLKQANITRLFSADIKTQIVG
jgi:hypothetical protein